MSGAGGNTAGTAGYLRGAIERHPVPVAMPAHMAARLDAFYARNPGATVVRDSAGIWKGTIPLGDDAVIFKARWPGDGDYGGGLAALLDDLEAELDGDDTG